MILCLARNIQPRFLKNNFYISHSFHINEIKLIYQLTERGFRK